MNYRKTDIAILLIRLILGIVFLAHGAQKVFGLFGGHGLQATVQFMTKNGMPVVIPYLVSFGELAAGVGFIFGFLTRIAAAGMFLEMLGGVFLIHWKNGFFMNWEGNLKGEGFEYTLTLCVICLALVISGAGAYSIDASMRKTPNPNVV